VIVASADPSTDPSAGFFAGLVDHIVLVLRNDKAKSAADIVSDLGLDARKICGAVLTGEDVS